MGRAARRGVGLVVFGVACWIVAALLAVAVEGVAWVQVANLVALVGVVVGVVGLVVVAVSLLRRG